MIACSKIGRKHTAADVYETMKFLEKENFTNVSIDLIYALPGQTLESFRDTLTRALALDLPHYSLYSLILENKTMFMNWVRQGRLQLPEEEIEAQMFDETIEAMEKKGRHQYEVSNFALTGKASIIWLIGIMTTTMDLAQVPAAILGKLVTKITVQSNII